MPHLRRCAAPGCQEYADELQSPALFRFPKDFARCRTWVQNCGNRQLLQLSVKKLYGIRYICGRHFEPQHFFDKFHRRLHRNAVPTVFSGSAISAEEMLVFDRMAYECVDAGQGSPVDTGKQSPHGIEPFSEVVSSTPGSSSMIQSQQGHLSTVVDASLIDIEHCYHRRLTTESTEKPFNEVVFSPPRPSNLQKKLQGHSASSHLPGFAVLDVSVSEGEHCHLQLSSECSEKSFNEVVSSTPGLSDMQKRLQGHLSASHLTGFAVLDASFTQEEDSRLSPTESDCSAILAMGKRKRSCNGHPDEQDDKVKRRMKQNKVSPVLQKSGLDHADIDTPRKEALLKTAEEYCEQARRMALKVDKLKGNCKGLREMIRKKKNVEDMEELVSPGVWLLIQGELQNFSRQPSGRRWSSQLKTFALAAYKRSPKMYRFLQCIMTLPSERTLQRLLMNIPLQPGFSEVLLQHLQTLMEKLPEDDRKCILMFDEMALQPGLYYDENKGYIVGYEDYGSGLEEYGIPDRSNQIADHALVFMIQGLKQKWKQPIAFFFSKGSTRAEVLVNLVQYAVRALFHHKVLVVATVCDQASCNQRAVKILRQSCEEGTYEPVFKSDGRLIVCLFDVPHILKNVRNNFLTADLVVGKEVSSWEHILSVYKHDREMYRLMDKLTEKHMYPRGKGKMRVKYAAQVFSDKTHNVMMTFHKLTQGQMVPGADITARRVKDINHFFDLTNGPSGPKDKRRFRCNVSKDSPHVDEWRKMKGALHSWRFQKKSDGSSSVPPCIKGWISTVTGMERLWSSLKVSFKYMNLRQLNQDSLENLFAVVRDTCGSNDSPTCIHFIAALKTAVVNGLVSRQLKGKNCEDDNGSLLSNLQTFLDASTFSIGGEFEQSMEETNDFCNEVDSLLENSNGLKSPPSVHKSYNIMKLHRQSPAYVCGFLVKQVLKDFDCALCQGQLTCSMEERSSDHMFIEQCEMDNGQKHLTYPSKECITAFMMCKREFQEMWERISHKRNVRDLVRKICRDTGGADYNWLSCMDHKDSLVTRLVNLFARNLITTKVKRLHEESKLSG